MADRPRILCLSFSNLTSDARVLRQLTVLAEYGEVTTVGYGPHPTGSNEHFEIDERLPSLPQTLWGVASLALRRHAAVELSAPAVRAARALLVGRRFDLVIANEARALPLAHVVAEGAPVWGDMHEWAPEERTHIRSWRLLVAPFMRYVCAKYLPQTDAVTTVNGSIAQLYDETFGCETKVVRNAIALQHLQPQSLQSGKVRLVHSGGAVSGRNLEALIEATLLLGDRFTLDFYLIEARDGGKYLDQLKRLASGSPRVSFHVAVPPHELPATLNSYDVGIYAIPPQTTNHRLMLPNKFFDFVQARLALAFGPTVETTALIEKYQLGVVADDFTAAAMAKALDALTSEDVMRFKSNADTAASALSSTEDESVQRAVISGLLHCR